MTQRTTVQGLSQPVERRAQPRETPETWQTALTSIATNSIIIRGYPVDEIMGRVSFADAIYLLADTLPAAPQDVLAHAAVLSGLPLPPARPYDPVQASPAQRRFYGSCKRIDARGTYEALHWRPRHPDYRYGLEALWQAGEGRPPRA